MTVRVYCPAKINLDLRVGPPRADGFHPIRSWFVTVGLYDTLTLAPADGLSLACDDPAVPADARNLVWRAAEALRAVAGSAGRAGRGVAMTLDKRIPAGGGLGGGSSDAAAALVALDEFWMLGRSRDELATLAATLGSDVPFFLHGPSAVCRGRGERVEPVPPPACRAAVLLLPDLALPTPAVFRRLDALRPGTAFDDAFTRPAATDALSLLPTLVNDLEAAAFDLRPELGDLRARAERLLGRPVRMSGSGSTLFTLYDTADEAERAATGIGRTPGTRALAVDLAPPPRVADPDEIA